MTLSRFSSDEFLVLGDSDSSGDGFLHMLKRSDANIQIY
ncbi:MAG: hypothetical protein UV58_C0012G0023 [Candidatus Wolfebacteria bacterium GW2011_GWC1_43_10]|uniref:Uncharacterized protein n=1 Tax=Candidatus Wolfebacteria bacterium GW2011_GWC1_43_10 TaxID=1619011 RepID=A0A0G1C9F7_9BACT|nr:MAG: hypothetical protein UV58_C0012G0023 [Candidatus Wolfebacteria bacterium GW2011_GWC1_43_10]